MAGREADRFVGLDGIRGFAAFAVLMHHVELINSRTGPFSHGYLFVDLFFVLSGFVIAHTYEPRFRAGLHSVPFMRARLIRLYPMLVAGALLGVTAALAHALTVAHLARSLALQLVFFPAPGDSLYPLNNVQWSLLFELLANVAHVMVLRRLPLPWLVAIASAALIGLILVAGHYGSLGVGYNIARLAAGVPRVAFSYTMGVILYRLYAQGRLPSLGAAWWAWGLLSMGIVLAAAAPAGRFAVLKDLTVVLAFPLIVWGAAGSAASDRSRLLAKTLGELSYPLYAIHYPLLLLLFWSTSSLSGGAKLVILAVGLCGICGVSWAMLKLYDEPTRAKFRSSRSGAAAPAL